MTPEHRSPSRRLGLGYDPDVVPLTAAESKIVVAGDWAGQAQWAAAAVRSAAAAGIRTIVHMGDLGVLMPGRLGQRFTAHLEGSLAEHDVRLVLVDGNHDAHARLRRAPSDVFEPFRRLGESIWWSGRGARWTWAGRELGALGGAHSVDAARLTEGYNLWLDLEEPTQAEAALLGEEPLDVLFCHDAPLGVGVVSRLTLSPSVTQRADETRKLLSEVVERTRPTLVFHGHWHQRRTTHLHHAQGIAHVHSLSNEWTQGNLVVLDLRTLEVAAVAII